MGYNWATDPKNKNKVTTTGTNYALFGVYDPTKSVGVKASEFLPTPTPSATPVETIAPTVVIPTYQNSGLMSPSSVKHDLADNVPPGLPPTPTPSATPVETIAPTFGGIKPTQYKDVINTKESESYTPTSGTIGAPVETVAPTVESSNPAKYSGNIGDIEVEEKVSTGSPVLKSEGGGGEGETKPWEQMDIYEKVVEAKRLADQGDFTKMIEVTNLLRDQELEDASAAAQKQIADHTASYHLGNPTYGAQGYSLATQGLAGSGYADYLKNQNYAAYRGNVQSALENEKKTQADIKRKYIDQLYNLSAEKKAVEEQKLEDYINYDDGEIYLDRLANDWSSFSENLKAKALKEYKDVYAPSNMSDAFNNREGVRKNYNDAERDLKELEAFANATGDPDVKEAYVKMENAFNAIYKVYTGVGDPLALSTDKFTDIDDNGDAIGFTFNGLRYNFYDITKMAEYSDAYINQPQTQGIFFYDGKPYYKRGNEVYEVQYEGTKLQTNVNKVKGDPLSTDKFTDIVDRGDEIGFTFNGLRYNFYDITEVAENSAAHSVIANQPQTQGIFIYDGKPYYKRGGDVYEIEYKGTDLQTNVPEISNSKISTLLNKPTSNQK